MAWVNGIDSTNPADTDQVKDGAGVIRTFKAAVLERLNTLFSDFANTQPLLWIAPPSMSGAGVPTSGVAGTGVGTANPGTLYFDTTGKNIYMNINTKASPTWAPFILGDSV